MLNVTDEFTHERLAIRVARRLKAIDVIDVLSDLFILRGVPEHIRSDNGPEFVAKALQEWIGGSAPRRPRSRRATWENGYVESFNARLRDELLDGETSTAQGGELVIEQGKECKTNRPLCFGLLVLFPKAQRQDLRSLQFLRVSMLSQCRCHQV